MHVRVGRVDGDRPLVPRLRAGIVAAHRLDEAEVAHRLDVRSARARAPRGSAARPRRGRRAAARARRARRSTRCCRGCCASDARYCRSASSRSPRSHRDAARAGCAPSRSPGAAASTSPSSARARVPVARPARAAAPPGACVERHAVLRIHARHLGALLRAARGSRARAASPRSRGRSGASAPASARRALSRRDGLELVLERPRRRRRPPGRGSSSSRGSARRSYSSGRGAWIHFRPSCRTPKSGAMPKPSSASRASEYCDEVGRRRPSLQRRRAGSPPGSSRRPGSPRTPRTVGTMSMCRTGPAYVVLAGKTRGQAPDERHADGRVVDEDAVRRLAVLAEALAVVGGEDDERVVEHAVLPEPVEQPSRRRGRPRRSRRRTASARAPPDRSSAGRRAGAGRRSAPRGRTAARRRSLRQSSSQASARSAVRGAGRSRIMKSCGSSSLHRSSS